jgi:hypothetical protein
MYYPHAPKEPSGCVQSLIITRMILGILLVPVGIIFAAILLILLTFLALSINPLLALLTIVIGIGLIAGAGMWEWRRISKDIPKDEA